MYTSYYGMSCNPFSKNESVKYNFECKDFRQTQNRLNYIKEIKGVCLITGNSGYGKTYSLRYFIENLNQDLYKIIYISITSEMSVFDFYKTICDKLNLNIGNCYRTEIYNNIQKEIKRLVLKDRVQPIVILDDAHLLKREIFDNFKVFYDFDMDSAEYVALIIVGHPELKEELSKNIHETLKQRIMVNYTYEGFTREEVKEYIKSRLDIANANNNIFTEDGINALYLCSKSSPRRLNILVTNSLMLGFQNKLKKLDSQIVMDAKNEMSIIK